MSFYGLIFLFFIVLFAVASNKWYQSRGFKLGFVMASMKYDLPMLDYKTRFSLWQVKMRAILAQTNDLDEAGKIREEEEGCVDR